MSDVYDNAAIGNEGKLNLLLNDASAIADLLRVAASQEIENFSHQTLNQAAWLIQRQIEAVQLVLRGADQKKLAMALDGEESLGGESS